MKKKPAKKAAKSRKKTGRKDQRKQVAHALDGVVAAQALADILGLTDQRLRELAALGMPKASHGKYPLRDAIRFYVDTLRKRQEAPTDGPTKTDMERDLLALKLKKAQGEVFDRAEVLEVTGAAAVRLGVAHENLATRIGRELNLAGEDVKMIRDMTDEMRRVYVLDCGEFIEVVENERPGQTAAA